MLSTKLKEAAGNSADATLYVDDVFSTWLYTGNGSTQTINNGIDLAGKGGMVWIKSRSATVDHKLTDTVRGATKALSSSNALAQTTDTTGLTAFSSTGFSLGASSVYNTNAATYASWAFRKAAKFFDVVTYTGTGSARTIAHSLGVAPGMVIVKRTDTTGNWQVYSNGLTSAAYSIQLNLTNAQASAPTVWDSTAPTSSVFSVGTDATVNASGGTYVAYLYAHDTSSTGIIQCGVTGGGTAQITLGWEPQYLLYRSADFTDDWHIIDNMRGAAVGTPTYNTWSNLNANTTTSETSVTGSAGNPNIKFTATGFVLGAIAGNAIYMAIRRPNKPPTSGTQVFSPSVRASGTGAAVSTTGLGFPPDLLVSSERTTGVLFTKGWHDRLRGSVILRSENTNNEAEDSTGVTAYGQDGFSFGADSGFASVNYSGSNYVYEAFKRAPGFFDVVCYTGTEVARTVAHNLTVAPELMIVKSRSNAANWTVYVNSLGNTGVLLLQGINAASTGNNTWNNTTPTSSVFSLGTQLSVNGSGYTFVAYLFATLAGISKVGSYTGNGGTQNIECGFAAGARFFLVKATSTTGSWWVWDSARGITAGNDPALQLNSTAAEITTADAVDPYSPGITVNQEATCSINANGVSYIFLAVA